MIAASLLFSTALMVACIHVHGLIDCDDVLKDEGTFTGQCNNKFKNLRPLIKRE